MNNCEDMGMAHQLDDDLPGIIFCQNCDFWMFDDEEAEPIQTAQPNPGVQWIARKPRATTDAH